MPWCALPARWRWPLAWVGSCERPARRLSAVLLAEGGDPQGRCPLPPGASWLAGPALCVLDRRTGGPGPLLRACWQLGAAELKCWWPRPPHHTVGGREGSSHPSLRRAGSLAEEVGKGRVREAAEAPAARV